MVASIHGRLQTVKFRWKREPILTPKDKSGKSALKMAEENKRTDVVQYLKSRGAN